MKIDVTHTRSCTQLALVAVSSSFAVDLYACARRAHVLISCLSAAAKCPESRLKTMAPRLMCVCCVRVRGIWNVDNDNKTHIASSTAHHSARRFSHFNEASCATTYSPLETKTNGCTARISPCSRRLNDWLTEWRQVDSVDDCERADCEFWNNYNRVSYHRRCN